MEAKKPRTRKKPLPPEVLTTYQQLMGKKAPKKPRRKPGELESPIVTAILEYLVDVRREFAYRNNTVGIYDPVKKTYRKMPKYARKGRADIEMVLKGGYFAAMEVKVPGEKQNPYQIEIMNETRAKGGLYEVVHDVHEAKIVLEMWHSIVRMKEALKNPA